MTAKSNEDYENIEKDMQVYANVYRATTHSDIFHSSEQHGFSSITEYNNWKNNMLKSVYENEGFYIGRYEAGIEGSSIDNSRIRVTHTDLTSSSPKAVSQIDQIPYNYIRCKEAQTLAKAMKTKSTTRTTSLMFGIQWDLILKFIETKGAKTRAELNTDSTTWGNYINNTFYVTRGKYSTNSGANFSSISGSYTKPSSSVLLTTGATERNKALNIYDLAGNVWEWTLEYTATTWGPCVCRGSSYNMSDSLYMASCRGGNSATFSNNHVGFRPVLY